MAIEFNTEFYLQSKFNQLEAEGLLEEFGLTSVEELEAYFAENGVDAEEHYLNYGVSEGINPSAEFDTNAYLEAKLAELQDVEKYGDTYADYTVEDVIVAFQGAGLTPLAHFNAYGADEGLEATPVDGDAGAPSGLTEALEAYQAAVEAQTEATVAYSEAVVEAGLIDTPADENEDGIDDNFDPAANDYMLDAEAELLEARQALSTARRGESDAELQQEVSAAQAEVNTDPARYTAEGQKLTVVDGVYVLGEGEGAETYTGTAYSARQLQSRVDSAQATLDAHVASNGSAFELATQLNAAIGEFLTDGGDDTVNPALEEFRAEFNALRAIVRQTGEEPSLAEMVELYQQGLAALEAGGGVTFDAENYTFELTDESVFVGDIAGSEAIISLMETIGDRVGLEHEVVVREVAFSGYATYPDDVDTTNGDPVFGYDSVSDVTVGAALRDAQGDWEERQKLIDAVTKAQADLAAISDAAEAYATAQDELAAAAEELGYEIQSVDSGISFGTDEADLFVFDFATLQDDGVENVVINDLSSDDLLFLGSDYALGTEGSADNNALEVFVTEVNGNAVLQVENTAFGSADDDFTSITLTGVAAADVTIESGVVSIA